MTTSTGTTAWAPGLGDLVLNAYAKCGIRSTGLTTRHLQDARTETNLIMADWTARGSNLWSIDNITVTLTAGTSAYPVPADTVFILDAYLSTTALPVTDTLIFPISRSDYAAIANKTTQARPTSFWFDKLIAPSIHLWPTPNSSTDWVVKLYRATQLQDASLSTGLGLDLPYRLLDAFTFTLASRLALIYAPDRAPLLDQWAQKAYLNAISSETEDCGVKIMANCRGYFK